MKVPSTMLIPSIDLMNGQAVQLRQGKTHVLTAESSPQELIAQFNRYGQVAVIDLDAALANGNDNLALIRQLATVAEVRAGGGIRTVERGKSLLRAGAKKIIIGTAATPEFLANFHPSQIMVALDFDVAGTVLDSGWTRSTGESVVERAERLAPYCSGFLCTFVDKEGGLEGLPLEAVQTLQASLPHPITVAGGVNNTENATELCKAGFDVQVGMALYKGLLDPVEVVINTVDFAKMPLVPTIVQDVDTNEVLMLAYSNQDSLRLALKEGKGIYWSRSRNQLWEKGKTSGHWQQLVSCRIDCDADTVLFKVKQEGGCCHTGADTCFGEKNFNMPTLFNILAERKATLPEGSFTAKLFQNRHKLDKKIIEEAFEATQSESREEFVWEIADAMFFLSMLAVDEGIAFNEIVAELAGRHR
jgi:phosphoribosyl-ATP pyrophosphohydrolase/phosphoribosyl-AMP cyclohydrolase